MPTFGPAFRPTFRAISFFILTSLISPVMAAEKNSAAEKVIDEVIVRAFRLPSTVQQTGSSIWIVSEEEIRRRQYIQITDALLMVPGVTINQNGAFGGQASARIRGASSDHTLVLVDGIVVNDMTSPGGSFNFGAMDVSDVQRIEVLKGPQSTLWGTDAIGGVINIVSKDPGEELSVNLNIRAGSFGTQQYLGAVSAGNEFGDFRISYADLRSDGISKADENDGNTEEDAFDSQTLSAKAGINLPGDVRLQFNYRSTAANTEFDSFGLITGVVDGDEGSETNQAVAQIALTFAAFEDRLQNTIRYSKTDIERDNFSNGLLSFSAEGERKVIQYQGNLEITGSQQLTFGYENEDAKNESADSSNQGLYALYQVNPTNDITLSVGLRQDDHDKFGKETVGRLSAAWQVKDDVNLRASWGEGFKAPTIFQTTFFCCGASGPNADLAAETSEAFDIGVDWQLPGGESTISVTYFEQDTENLITFSFAVGGYENIAEVESKGIELGFDYRFTEALSMSTNLAYIDSVDGTGRPLIRLPEVTADVALNWQPTSKFQSTLVVIYNDEEQDPYGTVDAWTRVDASLSYRLNRQFEFFGRIENLADKDYQQVYGYGTPGRSAYVGIDYQF